MPRKLIFFLFICLNSLVSQSINNLSKITFEPLQISSQFSSKNIQRIFQDKEGYVWFGSEDRIYRYDGYQLRTYGTNMDSSKRKKDNEVWTFAEDNNTIWIGTHQGIRVIDKKQYEISDWNYPPLKNVRINRIMRDSKDNIWICAQNGLYKYSSRTKRIIAYHSKNGDNNSLPGNEVNYIYEDQNNELWITIWECGLCKYIPDRDNFERYPKIGKRNNPFRVFQDRDKNYWIGSWGDGLFRFYPSAKGADTYKSFEIKKRNNVKNENIIFSIVEDDRFGYIWLVSFKGMFVITDVQHKIYSEFETSSFDEKSNVFNENNLFNEMTKDKKGNLWIGTYGNTVYTLNFNKSGIVNYNIGNYNNKFEITPSVNAMYEDNDGIIWLGLKRIGLQFFDKNKKKFINTIDKNSVNKNGNDENITLIKEIKSTGEIWITFENNYIIFVFTRQKAQIKFLRKIVLDVDLKKYPLSENSITSICEDRHKNVWIGSQAGLYRINSIGEIRLVHKGFDNITSITLDKSGNIWVSSSKFGIICMTSTGKIINAFNQENQKIENNDIQSLCCQLLGLVWAGGKDGTIYFHEFRGEKFKVFMNKLSSKEETILDISEDKLENIWISTNKKIIEINPKTMNSFSYTQSDGLLINPFNKGAYFTSQSGSVYFGGNNGFCSFPDYRFIQSDIMENKVIITNVKLQEKSISDTPFKSNLNLQLGELMIEPLQNNFEIDFSSFNYFSKAKIEYAYKIEEIDNDWNYISGDRFFVTYNNLPKGTYTFMVKVRNEFGVWSKNVTRLIIHKKPHLYETWWAYFIYILTFSGVLFYIYRSGINRLKLKNELHVAQIEKQSSEQLIQTKLQYFTNVSHELMTPLTIISCLIEDVQKDTGTKIWQFATMLSNINRLKRLLQQILDFKKMETGNLTLKVQWGDIVSFVSNICEYNFTSLINEKQINFEFTSNKEQIELYFDTDKIDKIIYNLLSNAIKHTQIGGNIHVELQTDDKMEFVRLIVNDNGKGIAPEELPKIFTTFYHSIKAKSEYSNGIGLSLTKELVELHHGTINVESQLNAGTIFIVEIPMNPNIYSENDFISNKTGQLHDIIIKEKEDVNSIAVTDHNTMDKEDIMILIVEDNPELRFILNKILSRDYQTIVAENGQRALELMREKEIDIILSDISMPEMDGLTLCKKLKSNVETSHIPIVLITARNTIEDRVECYNAGADGYLSKPFEQQILDAKIKNLIKSRRVRQQNFRNDIELNISAFQYPSIEEDFLNQIIDLVKNDYLSSSDFDPGILAIRLNISRSTLYRKIKSLTNLSPSDFIRNIRLKHACFLLRDAHIPIKEVAYAVGFFDQRYFSSCFKTEFGVTPSEFQKSNLLNASNKKN